MCWLSRFRKSETGLKRRVKKLEKELAKCLSAAQPARHGLAGGQGADSRTGDAQLYSLRSPEELLRQQATTYTWWWNGPCGVTAFQTTAMNCSSFCPISASGALLTTIITLSLATLFS